MYKVVCKDFSNKFWRCELTENQVKKDSQGMTILPDNFFTKEYYEELTGNDWDSLPILQTYGSFMLTYTNNR
jgi:hypothetical protein